MNKLIVLATFFLASCANTQYRKHDLFSVKYTVREYYLPVAKKAEVKPIKSAKKSVKRKASRLDCERVFKEINQCMKQ